MTGWLVGLESKGGMRCSLEVPHGLSPSTTRGPGEVRAVARERRSARGGQEGSNPKTCADEGIKGREQAHADQMEERATTGTGAALDEAAKVV